MESAKSGYAPAAFFLLKTRCNYRESGPTDGNAGVAINITIPPAMSRAEFEKMIDIAPDRKQLEAPTDFIEAEFEEIPAPRGITR